MNSTPIEPTELIALMPFAVASGVVIDSAEADCVVGHLDWAEDRCTAGGVLHGGALITLADSIGAACAFLGLPQGASTATTTTTTQLIRAVSSGTVTATARPVHRGRSQVVVQTDLRDDRDRLVATTVQSQAVLA